MKFVGTAPGAPQIKVIPANGHWLFPETMGIGVGFVYVIYDIFMRRAYIGKKNYFFKGLKSGPSSDWKKYVSSSKLLALMLEERPKEDFEFICLEQYNTKGTLSYAETWSICHVEAPTTANWYNTLIPKVSWNVKEPISERHKQRLTNIMGRIR